MTITCPHCGFSRETEASRLPSGPTRVTCPQCKNQFTLGGNRAASPETAAVPRERTLPEAAAPPVRCPVCGLEQAMQERCGRCGAALGAAILPFAGFWLRVAAVIVDSILVSALQFAFGLLLGAATGLLGGLLGDQRDLGMTVVSGLFGMALAVVYYVFFTGYGGQTPGKMLLRIKVIRTDGSAIGYGRAFLREVPGKFISGILLGIGYLMVAFDSRKQGLHDKIADTFVIKVQKA